MLGASTREFAQQEGQHQNNIFWFWFFCTFLLRCCLLLFSRRNCCSSLPLLLYNIMLRTAVYVRHDTTLIPFFGKLMLYTKSRPPACRMKSYCCTAVIFVWRTVIFVWRIAFDCFGHSVHGVRAGGGSASSAAKLSPSFLQPATTTFALRNPTGGKVEVRKTVPEPKINLFFR